jgi:hypothetical protein
MRGIEEALTKHAVDNTSMISDEKPIFIIGGGRSGTTLARYILNAHPNIYIAEEISYHIWMSYFRGNFRTRLLKYFHTFSYVWLRQNPDKILEKLPTNLSKKHFSLVYKEILKSKAQQYQRNRFGEKNPILATSLPQIYRDFPNAKVINIVRDPRANVHSHTTMPWASSSLTISNTTLRVNFESMKKYDDKILNIKLEDLIASPQQTIATMLDYVEEPWSDRVLNHAQFTLHNEGIPFPWLNEASKDRKNKSAKWTDSLSPAWIRLIERLNREQMERFGYATQPLNKEPGTLEMLLAMTADIPQILYCWYRTLRAILQIAITDPKNTWKVQNIAHSMNPKGWELHSGWDRNLPVMPAENMHRDPLQEELGSINFSK